MQVRTCGECVYWERRENTTGIVGLPAFGGCFGAPPSVFPSPQGLVMSQPTVPENFRACGCFKPREEEIKPAEA